MMTGQQIRHAPPVEDLLDCVVIGGGPAGLAAGQRLREKGRRFTILERGPDASRRDRSDERSLVSGVGGAGLYSDGKFSFYPSASALWSLPNAQGLAESYGWLRARLNRLDAIAPELPVRGPKRPAIPPVEYVKEYPSFYVPYNERRELINDLAGGLDGHLLVDCRVVSIRSEPWGFVVYFEIESQMRAIGTRTIVFAGGRFGALELARVCVEMPLVFRRYEIGLRLEQPADSFVFSHHSSLDVKHIRRYSERSEWRTFCTVRNGEIVKTNWDGMATFSGRGDGPPTGLSSVGLNLRFDRIPDAGEEIDIRRLVSGQVKPFVLSAEHYLRGGITALGPTLDAAFRERLAEMVSEQSLASSTLYGPCVEGTGYYPDISNSLKVNSLPIWVAGDSSGVFRGLTAALVSGRYAAEEAIAYVEASGRVPDFVKVSPSSRMTSVFTAQSKAFFYCRDAVCEFVFLQGRLPLNPFRAFEYFLGDRVDRNRVRQGNNELVAMCDELWVFGPVSDGVLFEIVRARGLHKPVRYFNVSTYAADIRALRPEEVKFEPELHAAQITRDELLSLIVDAPPHRPVAADASQLGLDLSS